MYDQTLAISKELEKNHASSEIVNYYSAVSAANIGELDNATIHMQRALDINPHNVEDSMFMLQYAEMLVYAEKKEEAMQVIERCKTLAVPAEFPQYMERIIELEAEVAIL